MERATERGERTDADRGGAQRALYHGFGNAFALGMELALVPVIFALGGLWIDRVFGTKPLFMLVFILLAVIGLGVRAYYTYTAQMAAEEEGKPWTRAR